MILLALLIVIFLAVRGLVTFVGQSFGSGAASETSDQAASPSLPPEPRTPALDFSGFDPGNIISDEVFYDSEVMSEAEIQNFLDEVNGGCRPGIGKIACIAAFTEDTDSYPADYACFAFEGEDGDTAASIIAKAADACGINPQVLLVMLQKEQGLLTASGARLTPTRYQTAMGYGCPDTAACDPQYFGFANQVYHAARQLRLYANWPEEYSIWAQADNEIAFHPNPECGAATIFVENSATAGLYNYTPYQPDEAVLADQSGPCSSVGNLNFYAYFNAWFG